MYSGISNGVPKVSIQQASPHDHQQQSPNISREKEQKKPILREKDIFKSGGLSRINYHTTNGEEG